MAKYKIIFAVFNDLPLNMHTLQWLRPCKTLCYCISNVSKFRFIRTANNKILRLLLRCKVYLLRSISLNVSKDVCSCIIYFKTKLSSLSRRDYDKESCICRPVLLNSKRSHAI